MTTVRRLRLLPAGHCDVDVSILTGAARGRLLRLPVWMYLVETSESLFCVDAGMPPSCIGNRDYFGGTDDGALILPDMRAEDAAPAVLARAGFAPRDVDALVATHLHFDHAGGMSAFEDVPVLLHEEEHRRGLRGECPPECFPSGPTYRPLSGERHELAPGLTLLHTPGHTPGHLSLLVELPADAPVLLTIDATYTRENWEGAPGSWSEPERGRASVERLREIARETGARVFFGHEPGQAGEPEWRPFFAGAPGG